jgi:hypothetical protein
LCHYDQKTAALGKVLLVGSSRFSGACATMNMRASVTARAYRIWFLIYGGFKMITYEFHFDPEAAKPASRK